MNLRFTPTAAEMTLAEQARRACLLIGDARRRGDLATYHSKTPRHRSAYRAKLNKLKGD